MAEPIILDGRTLEGGGQLLRNALCLAALTSTPIRIHDIRGNRGGGGGLKAQHLACVEWLATACNAKVEGAEKGSKELLFVPKSNTNASSDACPGFKKKPLSLREQVWETNVKIGSAGSTGLALQAVLPFILFSKRPSDLPVRLVLSGGTNVSQSPSYEYITQVLLPTLDTIGLPEIKASLDKRGWSHGGSSIGAITLDIPARSSISLPPFKLRLALLGTTYKPTRPRTIQATLIAPAACHEHFTNSISPAVYTHFGSETDIDIDVTVEDSKHQKRLYLITVAIVPATDGGMTPEYRLGTDWLYDGGIRSFDTKTYSNITDEMISSCVRRLASEWRTGGFVDQHLRDQLVVFQALAEGESCVWAGREEVVENEANEANFRKGWSPLREPSLHARTAEWVAKRMLGVRFDVEGRCVGSGFGSERQEGGAEELVESVQRVGIS